MSAADFDKLIHDKVAPRNFVLGFNALLHVFILFTFLVIFYKVIVVKLETDAIEGEVKHALNQSVPDLLLDLDETSNGSLKKILQSLEETGALKKLQDLYAKPDRETVTYNWWLFTASFIVAGTLSLLVVVVIGMAWFFDIDIKLAEKIRENAALFIGIGIVELVFFLQVALKYIPAPPSYLNQQVIDALKNL